MKETMTTHLTKRVSLGAVAVASALLFSACASPSSDNSSEPSESGSSSTASSTRVALTYDGGLYVLDGDSLDVLSDLPLEGFNRLNPAGDGRNVMVSVSDGFRVLDTAAGTDEDAVLTDLLFDAPTPGHVVRHAGKTILFSDGTGDTIIYETAALDASGELPETEVIPSEAAHHGVAIELEDGTLLSTLGNADGRSGIRVLDQDRTEIARSEDCPSVHGEGTAQNEVTVFGCSNGVLIYDAGEITKLTAPDAYGRTGNQYVSETSPLTVGDYNSDPDSEGSLLSQLVITDTAAKTLTVIDMPEGAEYTWRGVARTADNNALVLASDGALHTLNVETGEFTASTPVIDAWEGPAEWQDAHPALIVIGDTAYITDPATNSIHTADATTGEILATGTLDETPNEIAVVTQ
jgi:hypothetical protein